MGDRKTEGNQNRGKDIGREDGDEKERKRNKSGENRKHIQFRKKERMLRSLSCQ